MRAASDAKDGTASADSDEEALSRHVLFMSDVRVPNVLLRDFYVTTPIARAQTGGKPAEKHHCFAGK